jgi:peroxiredoxin
LGSGETIAVAKQEFTVPEMPGGRSDKPLDLGEVELTVIQRPEGGDAAPSFQVKTLDGATLRLADFRGKVVLLDFWATWCDPCIGETPHLQAVWEAFGSDRRFAMIGLSLDQDVKAPKAYAEKHRLKWHQGFLGSPSQTKLPAAYGLRGIPSIFLIGPDGKVLAKGLRGPAIKQAVAKALGDLDRAGGG